MDKYDMAEEAYKRGVEAAECKTLSQLRRENIQLRAEIEKLKAERDAFEADFLRGYKNQIEEAHGIYRCDMCKHTEGHDWLMELNLKDPCPKGCDGYKYWEWRGDKTND